MPTSRVPIDAEPRLGGLATWQGAGLSLAAIAWAVPRGAGLVLGALLASFVAFAFTRLHRHAPGVRSTADLIGSTLGPRMAATAAALQWLAYLLLAAAAAARLAAVAMVLIYGNSPDVPLAWWTGYAVIAIGIAALAAAQLPLRTVATLAGAAALAGLLIWFYLALAVIARVLAGSAPAQVPATGPARGLIVTGTVLTLALGVAGFELCSTANSRLRAIGRPMTLALAIVAVCAVVVAVTQQIATIGGSWLAPTQFGLIAAEFYGAAGGWWLTLATALASSAALLVLMAAATRIGVRQWAVTTGRRPGLWTAALVTGAVTAVMAAVSVPLTGLTLTVAVGCLLLLVLYLFVTQASSQIPGSGEGAAWVRVGTAGVLVAAVVVPLLVSGRMYAWVLLVATVLGAGAFLWSRRPQLGQWA